MCSAARSTEIASQQVEVADSVRESGVPEEDVEMVAETLGAAALSEDFPDEAAYIVPLAYRKRTLFKCNLRELYHLIK